MRTSSRSEETRARLLVAARAEFAESGMSGARVERIARQAGVNKERIYGYFGSKERLFTEVIAEALGDHAGRVGVPDGDLGEYAGRIYDFHLADPELTRLMMWEALYYRDRPLPDDKVRAAHYTVKVAAVAESRGHRFDERAAAVFVALIAVAVWPLAFPQMTRLIMGTADVEPGAMRRYVVAMADALVSAPGFDGL
ncbi:TetR family transcriptional regulator [Streptomyces sp. NPDC023723]|uniref:TetR family transcriptional regulator n=1 Tax=Streptomyces sp. NPDC023723 TaxID=3154323 RepID=UPI003400D1EA